MAVVFDASILIDLLNPRLKGDRRFRVDHLIESLAKQRVKILVPTPALTDLMVRAGKAREGYHRELTQSSRFRVEPFDAKAAMECALLLSEAWDKGKKTGITRTKFKFDWQIVAIAASRNATAIYSDDEDLAAAARRVAIAVYATDSLPLPQSALQSPLPHFEGDSNSDDA